MQFVVVICTTFIAFFFFPAVVEAFPSIATCDYCRVWY